MSSGLFLLATISLALLWSYPASVESDPRADAQAVIQQALAATQAVIQAAKSVETGANKQKVATCIETSRDAIDNLGDCKVLLPRARDAFSIDTVKTRASAALSDVGTCDDEFGASEPPQVKAATKKATALISQLLQILSKL
ncbi:hypothetical protein Salat_0597200 [Sesamum alatum]|uniref:Pectinesterase inhibitor domain-containing protein n=1 Tax=Sesamum alatum TaxID=300844 RepID=A0AAE2CU87_9LAMI|nr:hypothetical protein Salat_0597200 [Sesamum alatum]